MQSRSDDSHVSEASESVTVEHLHHHQSNVISTSHNIPLLPSAKRRIRATRMHGLSPEEECQLFCAPTLRGKIQGLCRDVLRPGDHIRVLRPTGTISHHGIYVGNKNDNVGGTVIHFCSDRGLKVPGAKMEVRETCWHIFINADTKARIDVVRYEESFDPEVTLEMAKRAIGTQGFSLFSNNCEHFATYCKVGTAESQQVKAVEDGGKVVMCTGVGATSGAVFAAAAGAAQVPEVLGSQVVGLASQSILARTTLGSVLSHAGVAAKLIVVPASPVVIAAGVILGAVSGFAAFSSWDSIKSHLSDEKCCFSLTVVTICNTTTHTVHDGSTTTSTTAMKHESRVLSEKPHTVSAKRVRTYRGLVQTLYEEGIEGEICRVELYNRKAKSYGEIPVDEDGRLLRLLPRVSSLKVMVEMGT